MKRGIVSFSDQEVKYLLQILVNQSGPLHHKLQSAAADELSNSQVELSEHELETIMDALPAPGQSSVVDELRLKLGNYFKVIALEQKLPQITSD